MDLLMKLKDSIFFSFPVKEAGKHFLGLPPPPLELNGRNLAVGKKRFKTNFFLNCRAFTSPPLMEQPLKNIFLRLSLPDA